MILYPDLTDIEVKARDQWRKSADVRTEFQGDLGAYLAYMRAEAQGGFIPSRNVFKN